ncbi:MAG: ATP-binding protein [Actinomycetota bacterium]
MVQDQDRRAGNAVLILHPHPESVGVARRFVAEVCIASRTVPTLCESAVLLASEIVTNAFIHGRSDARIAVAASHNQVRVEVADDNSRHPRRLEPDADALDGRGLAIVDLVAASWGVRDDSIGKTVWFEVTVG